MSTSPTASFAAPLYSRVHHVPTPLTFLDSRPRQTLLEDIEKVLGRKIRWGGDKDQREAKPAVSIKTFSAPLLLSTTTPERTTPRTPPPPYTNPSPPTYTSLVEREHREREARHERRAQRQMRTVGEDVTRSEDRWQGNWV